MPYVIHDMIQWHAIYHSLHEAMACHISFIMYYNGLLNIVHYIILYAIPCSLYDAMACHTSLNIIQQKAISYLLYAIEACYTSLSDTMACQIFNYTTQRPAVPHSIIIQRLAIQFNT